MSFYDEFCKLRNQQIATDGKISKNSNSSGYYRVTKTYNSRCKNGVLYTYRYRVNRKPMTISSVDITKLESKVRKQGLPWKKLNNTKSSGGD